MRAGIYWARADVTATQPDGTPVARGFLRSSDASPADAQRAADEAAAAYARRVETGAEPQDLYPYELRSKPEPVVDEVHDESGTPVGVITVNAYGANVLNTARVAFVDVDLPEVEVGGVLGRLFGKRDKPAGDPAEDRIERLRAHLRTGSGPGARVYRTAGGLRYLLTNALLDPVADQTRELFDRLGADHRYTRLCRAQECFRARLTPKPGRLRVGFPPAKIRADRDPHPGQLAWESEYSAETASFAVCELIEQIGPGAEHPEIIAAQGVHDELTGVATGLPLA